VGLGGGLGPVLGLQRIGGTKLASAAVTTGAITVPPVDIIFLVCSITNYSGADVASLRFNGDSGANYAYKHLDSVTDSTTVYTAATATMSTISNVSGTGDTSIPLGALTAQKPRIVHCWIQNQLAVAKPLAFQTATGVGSVTIGSVGFPDVGYAEWINTTAQITSIEMRTRGGSITLSAGSGFAVFGLNL
jgi:hypothetical protein